MADEFEDLQETMIATALLAAGFDGLVVDIDFAGVCQIEGEIDSEADKAKIEEIVAGFDVAGVELDVVIDPDDDDDLDVADDRAEAETYTAQKGDSWWGIAKRFYGSGTKWKLLKAANGSPRMLHPNDEVKILPLAELLALKS